MNRRGKSKLFLIILATIALAGNLADTAAGQDEEIARQGTFTGNWKFGGTVHTVEGQTETLKVYSVEGPSKVESKGGLAREFTTRCIATSDDETGGVARCLWTDAEGEKIFFEFSGEIVGPMGTVREAVGTVIGGTGRYSRIEGEIKLDWLFLESKLKPGTITGRTIKFEGSWKVTDGQ